ncbi:hypothetical protein [Actinomadura rupiterrae]|uniref:hypothetical protein n=1 Tax=Actinomadura rupiterrae TaxID=559627 RepID=UPI0020A4BE25|nr:hypothetical protein [Actinomadura rupiterrae]MCP2343391.1 hypothetical protein [Actinomadura rupiterrae]
MTHHIPDMPPTGQWPIPDGADCAGCSSNQHTRWAGYDFTVTPALHLWRCRACRAVTRTPVTYWPANDGPDCPSCLSAVTCWATFDPDHAGDLWICENAHEFTLTPEGIVIPRTGEAG